MSWHWRCMARCRTAAAACRAGSFDCYAVCNDLLPMPAGQGRLSRNILRHLVAAAATATHWPSSGSPVPSRPRQPPHSGPAAATAFPLDSRLVPYDSRSTICPLGSSRYRGIRVAVRLLPGRRPVDAAHPAGPVDPAGGARRAACQRSGRRGAGVQQRPRAARRSIVPPRSRAFPTGRAPGRTGTGGSRAHQPRTGCRHRLGQGRPPGRAQQRRRADSEARRTAQLVQRHHVSQQMHEQVSAQAQAARARVAAAQARIGEARPRDAARPARTTCACARRAMPWPRLVCNCNTAASGPTAPGP